MTHPASNSTPTWSRSTWIAPLACSIASPAHLPGGGESREGQRQMVAAVAAAFSRKEHAIIEAGTGVGKSLAYLVPAAMSGRRVVVATATKNLQDQLATKDAPTVAEVASAHQGRRP